MNGEISTFSRPHRCYLIIFFASVIIIISALALTQLDFRKEEVDVPSITHKVFMDIDIDGQRYGKLVIGLYGNVVPKTVENFRALCIGEKKDLNETSLSYKGTLFHRIVSGFVIQGGDVLYNNGRGSQSIYSGTFRDENFKLNHSAAGTVSMANTGPDSNGSQFFVTTIKASWLDGEHVVFGRVIQGMDLVYAIEGGAGTYNGKPRKKVVIADCGDVPPSDLNSE
ncbi:unnamed protein product [Rhodiola kirilowii]